MKKKYILIPIICIVVLIGVITAVMLLNQSNYLKKLPYDHVSTTSYNGVEIVGEEGLFYLVKDDKKVSKGYASLKSVNDYYGDIEELIKQGKKVKIFDYYIAHTSENSDYLIVNSEGDEVYISGDSYSLDATSTKLPFLVFVNNTNGLQAAVSLDRLDSDISYKSGNELTLRPFKRISAQITCDSSANCAYLETEDISDSSQKSYFRSDGIKITSGADISITRLYKENEPHTSYVYFYNATDKKLLSASGELISQDITERYKAGDENWQYTFSIDAQTSRSYITVFSPSKVFTLSSNEYYLNTFAYAGNCVTAIKISTSKYEIIGLSGTSIGSYSSARINGTAFTVQNHDGSYSCLDKNGNVIMTGNYPDMTLVPELSGDKYSVFSSPMYDTANNSRYYHFAKAGAGHYSLNTEGLEISVLEPDHSSFIIKKENKYSVFAPFSTAKTSAEYDTVSVHNQNGVIWCLAENYKNGKIDIVDPLTAMAALSINCSEEEFAKYRILHDNNIALATDPLDTDTAVHISIIKVEKYDTEEVLNSAKYYAVYRTAPILDQGYPNAVLSVLELGANLKLDEPYNAYTSNNYLVAHTSTGSNVFSLDESFTLSSVASIPYHIDRVIYDIQDPETNYFVVKSDNGMEGLYDTDSKAILAPYYNDVKSVEGGYITVSMRGAYGVIQSKSNGKIKTVIDFLYANIIPLGDGGYYTVMRNGQEDVYDKNKLVLTVNNIQRITSYTENENGCIRVSYSHIFSSDSTLHIHRSHQRVRLDFGNYTNLPSADTSTELNSRSTVIYYYTASKLVHTQVIHPTDNITDLMSSLYSQAEGQIWYTNEGAKEIVTENHLYNRHIIKLYSANQ